MGKYSRYKVNASELPELMAKEQGNLPPSEQQVDEFFKILDKDLIDITDSQKIKLQNFVTRTVEYNPNSLSGSMRKLLYKHYAYLEYGAYKISNGGDAIVQLEKGEVAEPDAIRLLSEIDGIEYQKNTQKFTNRWLKGIPDVLIYENNEVKAIKEIKIPLDLPSFLEIVYADEPDGDDKWEMLAYMDILGLKEGEICYCLVDMPKLMKEKKLSDYGEKLISFGVSNKSISKKITRLKLSMEYEYIPKESRIKRFTVHRKNYFTKQVHERVKLVRDMLNRIHDKFHINDVNLPENGLLEQQNIS